MQITGYSIEPRTRKYTKGYEFLLFLKNLLEKYGKTYWVILGKQEQCSKTCLQKIGTEATCEIIGYKRAEKLCYKNLQLIEI